MTTIITITAWQACETYYCNGRRDDDVTSLLRRSFSDDRPAAVFPTFGMPNVHREENCGKTTLYGVKIYGGLVLDEIDFGFFRESIS